MKRMTRWISLIVIVVFLFSASTVAWFAYRNTITFPTSFGSTQAAYFAGGDGSREEPYLIGSPVHLYNFAWLQYLGYFNLNENQFHNGRAQSYFRLSTSFDCQGLAIPPIGTEEYPFIGSFDGNGNVILNVTVSNHAEDLTRRPTNALFSEGILRTVGDTGDVSIVGLFGVTGNRGGYVENIYAPRVSVRDSLAAPVEPETVGTDEFYYAAMHIRGFYLDHLHVRSRTAHTLIGLVAGYVGSTVENAGVYTCDVELSGSAQGLTDAYGTIVSRYSIVGDYDASTVIWAEKPNGSTGDGEGAGAAWGGTIDMRALNRRLTYMIAKEATIDGSNIEVDSSTFKLTCYRYSSGEFYWDAVSTSYALVNLDEGTVLPISVNSSSLEDLDEITVIKTDKWNSSKKYTYHYNSYYAANQSEDISDRNTGYIVGGGSGSNGYIRSSIQPLASGYGGSYGIYKSLGFSAAQSTPQLYNSTNFKMLTVDINGDTYRVSDGFNGSAAVSYAFTTQREKSYRELFADNGAMYASVRSAFNGMMAGAYMAHGFHFMNKIAEGDYETTTSTVSLYDHATGSSKTHMGYPLVAGGINFTVAEDGVIKTIVGAFFGSGKNSLFDLYKVERQSSGTGSVIKSVIRIEEIYQDQAGNISYTPRDGYTLVFSMEALTREAQLENGAAYYFEIPVSAGDYVIGADKNSSTQNAYLMYLDIGANGGGTTTLPGEGERPYNISMVDFVSKGLEEEVLSVPVRDGGSLYPSYADVTFEISGAVGTVAHIWYRRAEYDMGLLTAATPLISTPVAYYSSGVTVTPSSDLGRETPSLGDAE